MDDDRLLPDDDFPEADAPTLGPRIVSLVPSVTESLFDLGLGPHVVGATDYCIYPADRLVGLPRVGGTKTPRVADIIALQPSCVIANREENRKEDVAALEAAGIQVWVTDARTVRQALDVLWAMTRRGGVPQQGPRLISLETAVDWQWQSVLDRVPARVFVPIWRYPREGAVETWQTVNRDTYIHDLLRICGAETVFADLDERYPMVTTEQIIEAAPEVILLPSEPFEFGDVEGELLAALPELDALIHFVDGSLLSWHGTRLALALQLIPFLLLNENEIEVWGDDEHPDLE